MLICLEKVLILDPRLNKRSKSALRRRFKHYGRPYNYRPRYILLSRLSQELGWTVEQVFEQLLEEREFILKHPEYY